MGLEAILQVRAETTLSTKVIDTVHKEVVKEIEEKISAPSKLEMRNGRELIELYKMYSDKPELDLRERACFRKIEAFFERPDCKAHYFYRNQYNLAKAREAAALGYFHGPGSAGQYIGHLRAEPDGSSGKPEDSAREDFERGWVLFVTKSLQQALITGSNELVSLALDRADTMLQARYDNLKRVQKVADPEVWLKKKEIAKILDDMDLSVDPLPDNEEKSRIDPRVETRQRALERLHRNFTLKELAARTPAEIEEDNRLLGGLFLEGAQLAFQDMLERAQTQEEKWKLLSKQEELIKLMFKCTSDLYKIDDKKKYEVHKILWYRKEADRQFWKGFFKDWAFLFLRNAIDMGSKSEKEIEGDLMKMLKAFT